MKFRIFTTSSYGADSQEIEINSIEELIKLVDEEGDIVVSNYNGYCLEIYNDYRE